jgi:hypothetical protein
MIRALCLVAVMALPSLAWAATAAGVLTIVDGDATVIREATKFPATEGLRLQSDDIVHLADDGRFVRIEFAGGAVLDLGPKTQVLVRADDAGPVVAAQPRIVALQGWLKLTAAKSAAAPTLTLGSPRLIVSDVTGVTLLRLGPNGSFAFAESGTVKLTERRDGRQQPPRALKEGQSFLQRAGEPAGVSERPAPELVQAMPRAFADTLPLRTARFERVIVSPKPAGEIAYDDVRDWLHADASLSVDFVARWKALARQGAFRQALVANLAAHPQWDRVLFPEKYLPKPPPKPAVAARPTERPAMRQAELDPQATLVIRRASPPPPEPAASENAAPSAPADGAARTN